MCLHVIILMQASHFAFQEYKSTTTGGTDLNIRIYIFYPLIEEECPYVTNN